MRSVFETHRAGPGSPRPAYMRQPVSPAIAPAVSTLEVAKPLADEEQENHSAFCPAGWQLRFTVNDPKETISVAPQPPSPFVKGSAESRLWSNGSVHSGAGQTPSGSPLRLSLEANGLGPEERRIGSREVSALRTFVGMPALVRHELTPWMASAKDGSTTPAVSLWYPSWLQDSDESPKGDDRGEGDDGVVAAVSVNAIMGFSTAAPMDQLQPAGSASGARVQGPSAIELTDSLLHAEAQPQAEKEPTRQTEVCGRSFVLVPVRSAGREFTAAADHTEPDYDSVLKPATLHGTSEQLSEKPV